MAARHTDVLAMLIKENLDLPAGTAPDRRVAPPPHEAFAEFVIPHLLTWAERGERTALVTIVQIDGAAPRPLGAQMAVSESGAWAGYISGGCLEQALVAEARRAIEQRQNRLVRYGEGSPYFDIRLPCGSGLELYIDQSLTLESLKQMAALAEHRTAFAWRADMASGRLRVEPLTHEEAIGAVSARDGDAFTRIHYPPVRAVVIGAGPIAMCTARLAFDTGLNVSFHTPEDDLARDLVPPAIRLHALDGGAPPIETDPWTGVLLSFHDHGLEIPLLSKLVHQQHFFLAAVGSRRAHEQRTAALRAHGVADDAIARIRSPAGLIKGVKSAPVLALSMLADMLAEAQSRGYV